MTLCEKEQLRRVLLLILEAARHGLTLREIANLAELRAFKNADAEFVENLEWLCAEGYAEETRTGISKLTRAWRITDAGVEYLDSINA